LTVFSIFNRANTVGGSPASFTADSPACRLANAAKPADIR
jgi:hypothetical protein